MEHVSGWLRAELNVISLDKNAHSQCSLCLEARVVKEQAQGPERNYIAGMPTFVGLSVYVKIFTGCKFRELHE